METKEVSEKTKISLSYCARWAKKNGVAREVKGGILAYKWSDDDFIKFLHRPKTKGKVKKGF